MATSSACDVWCFCEMRIVMLSSRRWRIVKQLPLVSFGIFPFWFVRLLETLPANRQLVNLKSLPSALCGCQKDVRPFRILPCVHVMCRVLDRNRVCWFYNFKMLFSFKFYWIGDCRIEVTRAILFCSEVFKSSVPQAVLILFHKISETWSRNYYLLLSVQFFIFLQKC